jgi:hypothetical protein
MGEREGEEEEREEEEEEEKEEEEKEGEERVGGEERGGEGGGGGTDVETGSTDKDDDREGDDTRVERAFRMGP